MARELETSGEAGCGAAFFDEIGGRGGDLVEDVQGAGAEIDCTGEECLFGERAVVAELGPDGRGLDEREQFLGRE